MSPGRLALLLSLATTRAAGVGPHASLLEWRAPADACPSGADVIAKATEPLAGPLRHDFHAVAEVVQLPTGRYRVTLRTTAAGVEGTRILEEASCQALADAVSSIIAWMIQPEETTVGVDDRPRAQAPGRRSSNAATPPSRAQTVSAWTVSARGGGDLGTLPGPALGAAVAVGYRFQPHELELRVSAFPGRRAELPPLPGYSATGGTFDYVAVTALGCLEPTPLRIAMCAGAEVGRLHGKGFGVSDPAEGSKVWPSFALAVKSTLRVAGPLSLQVSAEAVVPALRQRFSLGGVGVVHTPTFLAARTWLGLELRL